MKICDLTQIYSPLGGGVKSYLQAKRRYILEQTPHEHLMIVPGARTVQEESGRGQVWKVRGPLVNRTSRYRWMLDLPTLLQILYREKPDIVEAGDPYHAAMLSRNWANRRGADFYMFYHSHFPDAMLRTVLKFAGTWARKWVERVAGDYLRNLADRGKGVFVGSHHLMRVLDGWGVVWFIFRWAWTAESSNPNPPMTAWRYAGNLVYPPINRFSFMSAGFPQTKTRPSYCGAG